MGEDLPNADGRPEPERRGRGFVWVVRAAVPLTVAAFALAAWQIHRRPVPGLGWTPAWDGSGWYVERVDPVGPAVDLLQAGDRLLSLDGDTEVARGGVGYYRGALPVGSTYSLRVRRGGDEVEVELPLLRATGPAALRWQWMLEAVLWSGVALFIGLVRPAHPVARVAFSGALLNGLLYFLQNAAFRGRVPPLSIVPLHIVLGYHFFYRFPGGVPPGRLWNALLIAFYIAGGSTVLTYAVGNLTFYVGGARPATALMAEHIAIFSTATAMYWAVWFAGVVAMVAVIPRNYRLLRDPTSRRRVRWVVYGSIIGLSPMLLQSGRLVYGSLTGSMPPPFPPWFALVWNATPAAVPITVAYVMVKNRVFGTNFVLRRGMQYVLAKRALQVLLLLPVIALAYVILTNRDQTIGQLVTGNTGYIYWMGAATLSLRFREPLRLRLDRRFFRQEHNREVMLLGLLDDLGRLRSAGEVFNLVSAQLEFAFHPKQIRLWYKDAGVFRPAGGTTDARVAPQPPDDALLALVDRTEGFIELPLGAGALPPATVGWIETSELRLIVPIRGDRDRLVGVLILGEKKSEEPYGAGDRRLLAAIMRQAAIVYENLRLKAQVDEDERIRHEVLAKLDPGLSSLMKECPACGACFDGGTERCDRDGHAVTVSLPVERVVDSRYRLDRLIGRGGMGAVYEARDLRLERTVAVKVMLGRDFGQAAPRRRFQREATAAARLNHPNIVSVYDFGILRREGAYLVMERVAGVTLRSELDEKRVLAPERVADWFEQLLAGVAAAHERGVVHRDLKPENIAAQPAPAGGQVVKILDFGAAKLRPLEASAADTVTELGTVVGTMGYMSPEQVLGNDVDQRADIFALGVILVEALTGRLPFHGETYAGRLRALLLDDYHLPRTSPGAERIDAILQTCLAKDPRHRLTSASHLQRRLVPLLRACPAFG